MSNDGSVLAFTTNSTAYGGSGSGNAVVKRLANNPVAVPGFTMFGSLYPWLTPSGGYVGFYGYPDTTFDAGIYKLVPGAASATSVDLTKDAVISAVLSETGNLGAYLTDPDNIRNHSGIGTVFFGTTNLGAATSRITASADVSKIAYRNSNTIYYYGGSGGSATSVVTNAGGSNFEGPALSADGSKIAFLSGSAQISVRNTTALGTSLFTVAGEFPLALSSDGSILACKKAAANAIVVYKNGTKIGEITTSGNAAPLEISISTVGNYIGYVATNTIKHVYQWKNELPVINNISNPAAIEMDTAALQTVNLAGITSGDVVNESQTLSVSAAVTGGNNTNLIKNLAVTYTNANATGTITYNANDHQAGNAIITVTVNDSIDTITKTFTITINPNREPTIDVIPDPAAILEDAAQQTVNLSGITSGFVTEVQALTVTATSSNTALIPDPLVTYTSAQTTGTLKYTPVANIFGSAIITVKVKDNGGTAFGGDDEITRTFTVNVTPVNDVPSFTKGGNITVLEDSGAYSSAWATGMSSGPANESAQLLDFIVTNDNNALFSVQPAVSASGVLTFTTAANANGSATVTVKIHDDGGTANGGVDTSATQTFTISITAVNDVPSFTKGSSLTVLEDSAAYSAAWATAISAGPADESGQAVDFIVTNNNNALFSVQPAVSPTGVLTFTPAANANGSAVVTVKIHDDGGTANGGVDTSGNQALTIAVTAVNDVPSFTKGSNITVLEDSGDYSAAWATDISTGPANESAQTVDFIVTNDNNALFSTQPAVSATGVLTFTPAANANGAATVTVKIHDDGGTSNGGVNTSAEQTFTITVTTVNDVPSFTKGSSLTVLEDSGAYSSAWATAISPGPADESGQAVDFIVTNNNNALFSVQPAVSPTGVLTFTPATNANGSAVVTVKIHDDGGTANGGVDTSGTQAFTIAVTAVNDVPSFTKGGNITVLEDSGNYSAAWATDISTGPANESAQTVDFIVTNDNNALFSTQPAVSATGVLTFTPAANANGAATVTVKIHDDGGTAHSGVDTSATQTFTITVTAVNDVPSFNRGPYLSVLEDTAYSSSWSVTYSPGPAVESGQAVDFIVTNDNNALFSVQPAVSPTGVLTFTTAANANGSATVTVKIHDDGGTANGGVNTSAEQTFTISVTAVNDVPSFTKGANVTVLEDSGAYSSAWATAISSGPANESAQAVDFIVTNDNNALFSTQPAVSATGELTFTPAANANGSATVTVMIHDDGGTTNGGVNTSAEQTFTITVTAVNDVPSFTKGANVTVLEDSGAYSGAFETAISSGPADESAQVVNFIVTNNKEALFSEQPAVSASGVLTFTPAANVFGTALVTIQIHDNGGVLNGGVDTSVVQSFSIIISSVNDVPYFTKGADVTVSEDSAIYNTAWATNIKSGPSNESTQALNFIVTNDNNTLFSTQPAVSPSGVLTFTPDLNAFGTTTVSVSIHDDGGTANGGVDTSVAQTFVITVSSVNDVPSFTKGADVTVLEDSAAYSAASATAISPGPANESGQTVDFLVSNNNNALFSVQPAISETGVLTFTPTPDAFGTATVSVQLHDNGGVLNGGVDTSAEQTFTITVTSVNDIPTLNAIADPAKLIGGNSTEQTVAISGISAGPANESSQILTITATSSNTAMIPSLAVDYTQGDSTATIRFTPTIGVGGSSVITVTVTDDGGTANSGQNTVSTTFNQEIDIKLYSLALSFDKVTPQLEGTEIAITAIPNGGTDTTFYFTAINSLAPTVVIPLGTGDYQNSPTVSWTPDSGRYTIKVYAKDGVMHNVVSKTYTYVIYRDALLLDAVVSLVTSRATPQALSVVPIALTASLSAGSTGIGLKYKFTATNSIIPGAVILGDGLDANGYQDSNTVDWTPDVTGQYTLRVDVKDPSNSMIKSRTMSYTIFSSGMLPDAIVNLTPSKDSPQLLSVDPISLTATLSAGSTGIGLKYKFTVTNNITKAVDWLGDGLDASKYQDSNTVNWTPVVGQYSIRVDVKDPSNNLIKYKGISYTIYTDSLLPDAIVNLTPSRATPQLLSVTPISLTATLSAGSTGIGLKYQFIVTDNITKAVVYLGSDLDAFNYQDSNTVNWTPVVGQYIVRVYVKDPNNNLIKNKAISYTICSEAMQPGDSVSLTASPVSPQLLSVGPITLTAALQIGTGDGLLYKFTAQNYTTKVTQVLGEGLDANGYQLAKTVSWTPPSAARYTLRVDVWDTSNNMKLYKVSTYYIN